MKVGEQQCSIGSVLVVTSRQGMCVLPFGSNERTNMKFNTLYITTGRYSDVPPKTGIAALMFEKETLARYIFYMMTSRQCAALQKPYSFALQQQGDRTPI
jgi:hypothetical protein